MGSLKHPLQSGELARGEGGPVAARFLPFPVVAIQNVVFFCEEKGRETYAGSD
jgi:hypothetical protein